MKQLFNLPIIFTYLQYIVLSSFLLAYSMWNPLPNTFIALGDSVPSGYGLYGYRDNPVGTYTSLLFEKLYNKGHTDKYINLAESGLTTTTLLEHLHSLDDEALFYFTSAEVITLNIGGNNILTPFLRYTQALRLVDGAEEVAAGAGGVWSGIAGAWNWAWGAANSNETDGIMSNLDDVITGLEDILHGIGDIVMGTPSAAAPFLGFFSPELEAMLVDGIGAFYREFTQIITWIETAAPNATIIVNTIYNPIPPQLLFVSLSVSQWATYFINAMNNVVITESEARGHLVVNMYEYMTNRLDLMVFNLNPFADDDISFDIIHPNASGHALIAQLKFEAYMQDND